MKIDLNNFERFEARHNAPNHTQIEEMLKALGVSDIDELISQTVPEKIRLKKALDLPEPLTEYQFLRQFKTIAQKNKVYRSYIGMGYYNTITPPVILRNIMENPGWYTAYTPYQAEIAQGRLEMLLNFQTMVTDLTGMELTNASLLDEATAAGEVVHMFHGARKGAKKKQANKFFASENCHPQTLDLLKTRCTPIGVELVIGNAATLDVSDPTLFGVLVQYPDTNGAISDYTDFIAAAHENSVLVAMASDLLALTVLKEPGKMDADAVVGSAQRFGVPMGYGGPHAGFLATRDIYKRQMPGRIIGVSKDKDGNEAYRMALQTREQHIKRERATSNICTAQVLLGVMAAAYAIYHGPEGLKTIAYRTHGMANLLVKGVEQLGFEVENKGYFDTVKIKTTPLQAKAIRLLAEERMANFRYFEDGTIGLSMNQTTDISHIEDIIHIFQDALSLNDAVDVQALANDIEVAVPSNLQRESDFLTHPVFSQYHAEHEMLRYLKRLENKDLSLVHSMISLGSCTMKLNATAEMIPVTWPEFGQLHPFAPKEQAQGYQEIFKDLEAWLCEITGFDAMSLQPNSGANGEYAGLLTIRAYHEGQGEGHRNIAIIPSSAHGTNPASAVMAGMKVVIVKCDEAGNIDVEDLKAKAEQHSENLSSLMITYPSTHGVFEESVIEICQIIHDNGGRVYMDGANMNAQVGLTSPANIGADVCHLNLHKTFCIPHGGGGPGVGPIGVVADLAPYLPGHAVIDNNVGEKASSAVSAAPWGSASILPISYAYIRMMGAEGLTNATKTAILNANYMQVRLKEHYPVLYVGANGRNAHEMIVDCRQFKPAGIEVEDIAKRLMDYGYHAPTVSFPVPGTLMIEPTESESKAELDQFCDAMISIRQEIQEVVDGIADPVENVMKNAPHTQAMTITEEWALPYSRQKAVYPLPYVQANKFWPTVRRIDSAFGDRNLICSCIPVSDYVEAEA